MPQFEFSARRANVDDLQAICDLAQELNRMHHEAWPNHFALAASPGQDSQHWNESIVATGRAAFLVEHSNAVPGFITVSVADELHSLRQPMRYGRVNSVCVVPSARGQGVGTTLMAAAEQWAHSQGAVDMQLVVWGFNGNAVRLYKELGYSIRSYTMGKSLPLHST